MGLLILVCFIIFLLNKLDFSIKPQPPPYDVRWRHPRCFECIYFKKCKGVNPPRRVSMSIKANSEDAAKSELYLRVPCTAFMDLDITRND